MSLNGLMADLNYDLTNSDRKPKGCSKMILKWLIFNSFNVDTEWFNSLPVGVDVNTADKKRFIASDDEVKRLIPQAPPGGHDIKSINNLDENFIKTVKENNNVQEFMQKEYEREKGVQFPKTLEQDEIDVNDKNLYMANNKRYVQQEKTNAKDNPELLRNPFHMNCESHNQCPLTPANEHTNEEVLPNNTNEVPSNESRQPNTRCNYKQQAQFDTFHVNDTINTYDNCPSANWIILLAFLMSTMSANAAPLHTELLENYPKLSTVKLQSTPFCNPKNLDMSETCQTDLELLNLLLENCEFKCEAGEEPICVNTQQGGSAYICSPLNLTCEAGTRRVAWIDENNAQNVIVQEELCPDGHFQKTRSLCFNACHEEHLDINATPEEYIVYSVGDHKQPTYVYCNYKIGYYNAEGKTLLNYDQDAKHNYYFCQNVSDRNPCDGEYAVLQNGTCVLPCPPGECRDDHDGFVCKKNCSSGGSITAPHDVSTNTDVTTKRATSSSSSVPLPTNNEDGEYKEKGDIPTDWTILIAVLVPVLVVVLVVIVYLVYIHRRGEGASVLCCSSYHNAGDNMVFKKKIINPTTTNMNANHDLNFNVHGLDADQPMLGHEADDGLSADTAYNEDNLNNIPLQLMTNLKEPDFDLLSENTEVKLQDQEQTYRKRP